MGLCSQWILGWDFDSVPYFSVFPPVYYGYAESAPVLNPSIRPYLAESGTARPAIQSTANAGRAVTHPQSLLCRDTDGREGDCR